MRPIPHPLILLKSLIMHVAMERATYTSKSFLIALALTLRKITAEQAAQASHVEVNSQIEKWGEVEDCKFFYHPLKTNE